MSKFIIYNTTNNIKNKNKGTQYNMIVTYDFKQY